MNWRNYLSELQRRHVVKAGIAYLVVAWLIIQVLSILFPAFEASSGAMKTTIIILGVGFPIWLVIAWVYDFSPGGIKKTESVKFDEAIYKKKDTGLNRFIIGGLSIAVVLLAVSSIWLSSKIQWNSDGKIAIAVLPFDNFSPDEENEWIGDGVAEQLLTQLSKLEAFHVISRTSVMQYKNLDKTIPQIAKELNVTHILEGSVQVQGGEVLVTAQLVDNEDKHLWAETYKGTEDKTFDLQASVSSAAAKAIFGKLSNSQTKKLETIKQIDPEARKYFVLGNRIFDRMDWDGMAEAVQYYRKAVELEAEWDEALAGLAYSLAWKDPDESIKYSNKALIINPSCDQAAAAKGVYLSNKFKGVEAIEFMENFIDNFPDSPWTLDYLASMYLTDWSDSLFNPERAYEMSSKAVKTFPNSQIFLRKQIFSLIQLERLKEADSLIILHKPFFDKMALSSLRYEQIIKRAQIASMHEKNYSKAIEIYKSAIDSMPHEKARYQHLLSLAYNEYFNDNARFLEFARKAWDNREFMVQGDEVNHVLVAAYYGVALLENGLLKEAEKHIFSKEYFELYDERRDATMLDQVRMRFYFENNDLKNAEKYIDENSPYIKMLYHAYQGYNEKAYRYAVESGLLVDKVELYAILNVPDSLFHYLNQVDRSASYLNGETILDPYRADPRYIAFRRKHYLKDVSVE